MNVFAGFLALLLLCYVLIVPGLALILAWRNRQRLLRLEQQTAAPQRPDKPKSEAPSFEIELPELELSAMPPPPMPSPVPSQAQVQKPEPEQSQPYNLQQQPKDTPAKSQAADRPSPELSLMEPPSQWRPAVWRWCQAQLQSGQWLAKLGLALTFVGAILLMRLASQLGYFPIELRMALVAVVGYGLLVFGWRLNKRRPDVALPTQGMAIGLLMLCVYASADLFGLFDPRWAFILLLVLVAKAGTLASLQRSQAMAIFALVAGFATPLLASRESGSALALFSYYGLLNVAIFGLAWRHQWRLLSLFGAAFSFVAAAAFGFWQYQASQYPWVQAYLLAFIALYSAVALLWLWRNPQHASFNSSLVLGVPLLGFGLQFKLVQHLPWLAAFSALGFGLFYALIGLAVWRAQGQLGRLWSQSYWLLALIFASLAIPLALESQLSALIWLIEAGLLFGLARKLRRPLLTALALALQTGGLWLLLQPWLAGSHAFDQGLLLLLGLGQLGFFLGSLSGLPWRQLEPGWLKSFSPQSLRLRPLLALSFWPVLALYGILFWLFYGESNPMPLAASAAVFSLLAASYSLSSSALARLYLRLAQALIFVFWAPSLVQSLYATLPSSWQAANWNNHWFAILALISLAHWLLLRCAHAWPRVRQLQTPWVLLLLASPLLWWWAPTPSWPDAIIAASMHSFSWLMLALIWPRLHWPKLGIGPWVVRLRWVCFWLSAGLAVQVLTIASPWYASDWPEYLGLATMMALMAWQQFKQQELRLIDPLHLGLALTGLAVLIFNLELDARLPQLLYLPILNPLDLLSLGWLVLLATRIKQQPQSYPLWLALGLGAWLVLNGVLGRSYSHWLGLDAHTSQWWQYSGLQGLYSLVWASLALILMRWASHKHNHRVWLAGAVLLAVTVVKLFIIDLANSDTLGRIISFMGVGLLMWLAAWLAPWPKQNTTNSEQLDDQNTVN